MVLDTSGPRCPICGTERRTDGKPLRGIAGVAWHICASAVSHDRRHRDYISAKLPGVSITRTNIPAIAGELEENVSADQPTTSGFIDPSDKLRQLIDSFRSVEYAEDSDKGNTELQTKADIALAAATVERRLWGHVKKRLIDEYGSDDTEWWRQGVNPNIRKKCNERMEDCDYREDPYCYTDLVDFSTILNKQWTLFEEDFRALKPSYVQKKEFLSDFVRFNELRHLVHGSRHTSPTDDDLEFIHAFVAAVDTFAPMND
ncbi:MAG: hypothetical protein IIC92_08495 [Chloroflexi bacterium]|nr:hypothetical protein [Chloroflexota bacterium]